MVVIFITRGQNNNCNCPRTEADCISVMSNAAVTIFESKALFDISKQSSNFFSTFRNSLRNFEALFELSCENSILSMKWRSKFRLTFRGLARFFANGKTIAVSKKQRKFEENSFGSKYRPFSKVFETFRRNSSKFVLITFAQYCTRVWESCRPVTPILHCKLYDQHRKLAPDICDDSQTNTENWRAITCCDSYTTVRPTQKTGA